MSNVEINAETGETGYKAWFTPFELATYNEYVERHEYEAYRSKTTVVVLILKSGFEVVGTAGCEDPAKYNEQLGHKYALKDALQKLGEFAAFHRAQMNMLEHKRMIMATPQLSPFEVEEIRRLIKKDKDAYMTPRTFPVDCVSTTAKAHAYETTINNGGTLDIKA